MRQFPNARRSACLGCKIVMPNKSNSSSLTVVDASLSDVFGDIARIHLSHRPASKAGKIILLRANGRNAYAVARGLRAGMSKENISLDSALRERLGVSVNETYDFKIDSVGRVGELVWAWRSTDPVPRVAAWLGAVSVAFGAIGILLAIISMTRC